METSKKATTAGPIERVARITNEQALEISSLVQSLTTAENRFNSSGNARDLDQVLSTIEVILQHPALEILPEQNRFGLLLQLGKTLLSRYGMMGNTEDLHRALSVLERAVQDFTAPDSVERGRALIDIASIVRSDSAVAKERIYLDKAIEWYTASAELLSKDPQDAVPVAETLGTMYRRRYAQTADPRDIDAAVQLHGGILRFVPDPTPARADRLDGLACDLLDRFGRTGSQEDLDHAITLWREAVSIPVEDSEYHADYLFNLASALGYRFELMRDPNDLELAVKSCQEAIGHYPAGSGKRTLAEQRLTQMRNDEVLWRAQTRSEVPVEEAANDVGDYLQGAQRFYDAGDFASAIALWQKIVAVTGLSEKDPRVATVVDKIAAAEYQKGNTEEALRLYRQILTVLTESGADEWELALPLTNLAAVYLSLNELNLAEEHVRRGLTILSRRPHEAFMERAAALHTLATVSLQLGKVGEAEQSFQAARKIWGEHPEIENLEFSVCLSDLATLYQSQGKYSQAEPLYREALGVAMKTRGEIHPDVGTILNGLGLLYADWGELEEAENAMLKGLEIMRETRGDDSAETATALNSLGSLYQQMGKLDEAEESLQRALTIRRKVSPPDVLAIARTLNNLGFTYLKRGELPKAEPVFRESVELRRKVPGNRPDLAQAIANLGFFYNIKGNYRQAEDFLLQALEMYEKSGNSVSLRLTGCLQTLAYTYAASGRGAEALDALRRQEAVNDVLLREVLVAGSEAQRMAFLKKLQANTDFFVSVVWRFFPQEIAPVTSALDLVLRRKALGVEALTLQREMIVLERYPHLIGTFQELTRYRQEMQHLLMQERGASSEHMNELLGAIRKMEAELARQIPEMDLEQRLDTANCAAVSRALPAGSALVEIVRFDVIGGDARYVAFVMGAEAPERIALLDLGEAQALDDAVADFGKSMAGGGRHLGVEAVGGAAADRATAQKRLGDLAVGMLAQRFKEGTKLFIAPDGELSTVPFEVLPYRGEKLMIEGFSISYLGCGRDLLRRSVGSSPRKLSAAAVIAAPDFDLAAQGGREGATGRVSRDLPRAGLNFSRLVGTIQEGRKVADLLGARAVLGSQALESTVKGLRAPFILHLATHGFFLPDQKRTGRDEERQLLAMGNDRLASLASVENPMLRSGLALAGANTWLKRGLLPQEAEDGILTAEDVSCMDLFDTELVVLSACQTGLGRIQAGEGVFGLRRAFIIAGAKTVVMSLWKVPDEQTQELMVDFYRRLQAGFPKAEALRGAQLALRATCPDPWYWGAFICQGDPGPLSRKE